MGVPDFQTFLLPLLRFAGDGKEHSLAEALAHLAAELKLSPAEQDERLPSGLQSRFANRVAWARVYLKQADLLLSPRRGHFVISDRGRQVLKSPPPMQHLYHHINTAWNARNVSTEGAEACSEDDFQRWRQFPPDIDMST